MFQTYTDLVENKNFQFSVVKSCITNLCEINVEKVTIKKHPKINIDDLIKLSLIIDLCMKKI